MASTFSEFFVTILESGLEAIGLFYGVYRAKVISKDDPKGIGRLMLHCEQVHGEDFPKVWAWPEAGFGGKDNGLWIIPDVGTYVYVRFDHGRVDKPIWHGGWWADGEVTADMTTNKVTLQTKEGLKLVMDRSVPSIRLQQADGNSIHMTPDLIHMTHNLLVKVECPKLLAEVSQDATVNSQGTTHVASKADIWVTTPSSFHLSADASSDFTTNGPCTINAAQHVTVTSANAVNVNATNINLTATSNISLVAAALDMQIAGTLTCYATLYEWN